MKLTMLFPNHPAYAEIRAGMGFINYVPGANALAMLGGYSAPAHDLGEVSEAQMQAAWDAGLDGPTIDALSAAGATDADIQALMAGTTDVPTLMAKYAGLKTTEGTTVTTTPPQGPAPSQAGQVPSGSTLLYTATYAALKAWTSASSAIEALSPLLPSHGMSILTQQVSSSGLWSSNASFSVTVMDSVGHALLSDAKSVLDALMNEITNNGLQSSSLTLVSPGTTASGQPQPPGGDNALAWLENNAIYIGVAVGALVLLNNFTGRRR